LGIKESDYLTLSDGRYDEFHEYNDYERVGSAIIDMRTNKIARFIDRDSVIGEGMAELDMTTRFLSVDPMAEKYFQMSPYAYCANNPILFIDPNGEEIWIYYTDDKGKQQSIQYSRGMSYKGNSFVETAVGYMNKMDKTDNGHSVLGNLILSKNNFNFKNQFDTDKNTGAQITNQLSFTASTNGGGDISAGALMGNILNNDQKLSSTAHELFHGYQRENGESGANSGGINREVGAFIFGEAIRMQYEINTTGGNITFPKLGNNSNAGQSYNDAMTSLIMAPSFNYTLYNTSGNTFLNGSVANSKGTYNSKSFNANYSNPLIRKLFPLIKYPK
jgi:hypothetical protein